MNLLVKVKYISNIFRAANANWPSRIFSLVFFGLLAYFILRITEAKTDTKGAEECTKQRGELIQALIDIRTELSPVNVTSYEGRPDAFIYAIYDTTKPVQSEQQKVQKVLTKIDSILLKYKLPQQKKQI